MTDQPALARAIFEALNLFDSLGPVKTDEDIATIERVLAEHETALKNESAIVINAAEAWLDCAEGRTPSWNNKASKPIDLVHDLVHAVEAAEARCATLEQERKGYESEADRLTTQYVVLQAEHERLRAAVQSWVKEFEQWRKNDSQGYDTLVGLVWSLLEDADLLLQEPVREP